jgi:hypothetical protein
MKISVLTPSIRPQYLDITQKSLEKQTYTDFEWLVEVGLHGQGFTMPQDMNKMLRRAKGDIIVSLQDCIEIPADALAYVASLDHEKKAYTYPVSKNGKFDWRKARPDIDPSPLTGNMWEIDFASAPKSLFFDIGGFDERYSEGWSFDNVEVGWRAAAAGYTFYADNKTQGNAIDHDALVEHPHRSSLPFNAQRSQETARNAERGMYKLSYLY